MYIEQKNLLTGLDKGFVKKLMERTLKKRYEAGRVVYRDGQHAGRFYVLVTGCVKLSYGTAGQVVFTLNHAGEAFGWSSLLGRNAYAATAVCTKDSTLISIDRIKFNMLLDEDPVNGLILVRRLADLLGERLKRTYQMMAAQTPYEIAVSYGTGQTMGDEVSPA